MLASLTYAYDINDLAQKACQELAAKNGVSDRVKVQSNFRHKDFAKFKDSHTLIFCDIEGAEVELLDPKLAPALQTLDIIVEAHESERPGTIKFLIERFSLTHEIEVVKDHGQRQLSNVPAWFENLSHLDQLLATWEWRSGPTPWLVMKAKHFRG
jgi:hypothetical protein